MSQSEFSRGGIIPGPMPSVRVERLGVDARGHCLYSIAGGDPEHVASAEDIRQGRTDALTCTLREVAR